MTAKLPEGRRFELGVVVATPGALERFGHLGCAWLLHRHAAGDWGDISPAGVRENLFALREGLRILSAYETPAGRAWIITEADRSSTCILLPEDY